MPPPPSLNSTTPHTRKAQLKITGWKLTAAVFLALMILTNLVLLLLPISYDARFRFPRASVRGWDRVIDEARAQKSRGNPVVFVLGDSIGWGYSSRWSWETLAFGLQQGIAATPIEQRPSPLGQREPKVFNLCAMSAYAPDQYALLMRSMNAADLIVLQVYPGHYSEPYLEGNLFPSYSDLVKGWRPTEPLARALKAAVPAEHYPQRLLGWVEAPTGEGLKRTVPLVRKKDAIVSLSGMEITDPLQMIKTLKGSNLYLPFPSVPEDEKKMMEEHYAKQLAFKDGPKTARALMYYDGIFRQARAHGVPIVAVVTPWSPLLQSKLARNLNYQRRMTQLREMTRRNGGYWLDYNEAAPLPFQPEDFHDYSHLLGEPLTRLGIQLARDLPRTLPTTLP